MGIVRVSRFHTAPVVRPKLSLGQHSVFSKTVQSIKSNGKQYRVGQKGSFPNTNGFGKILGYTEGEITRILVGSRNEVTLTVLLDNPTVKKTHQLCLIS